MRVHINAGGREVTIECSDTNISPNDVAAQALALWTSTAGAHPPTDGPATGQQSLGFAPSRSATSTARRAASIAQ